IWLRGIVVGVVVARGVAAGLASSDDADCATYTATDAISTNAIAKTDQLRLFIACPPGRRNRKRRPRRTPQPPGSEAGPPDAAGLRGGRAGCVGTGSAGRRRARWRRATRSARPRPARPDQTRAGRTPIGWTPAPRRAHPALLRP